MIDEAQHDPLPYILDGLDITTPEDSGFAIIACVNPDTRDGGKSRGQFIVRACNSHYALLEALEVAITYMPNGHVLDGHFYPSQDRQKAAAAIAKARGRSWPDAKASTATPTCADRAQWAESAVAAYAHAKEGRAYDPVADMASDLFTDLCHLFLREGVSPEQMMERARTHYQEERAEEGRGI